MLHSTFGRKLNRDIKERKALFKSLIVGLINTGKITTTLAKGKAITGLIDKIVTHAKDGSNGAINKLVSFLGRKDIVEKLTKEITPSFANRVAGYTRMRRIGKRRGDNTEEVTIEWTDKPEEVKKETKALKTKIPQKVKKKEKAEKEPVKKSK